MIYDSNSKYRLLVIEDNAGDFVLIEDYLSANSFVGKLDHASTFSEAEEYLGNGKQEYHAVLLDLSLPDKEGEDLIEKTVKLASPAAVIVLTGYADMHFSVRSLSMGISDYIIKDNLNPYALWKSIRYSIERNSMFKKLRNSEARYRELFQNNPSPMLIWNPDSRSIIDSNKEAEIKYGYSQGEFLTLTVDDIQLDKFERPISIEKNGSPDYSHYPPRQVWRHQKKDGEVFFVEVNGHLLEYKGEISSLMLMNDVTDKIDMQERMIENVLQAEEKERNRVARELHDGIVQQLVACGMFTQNLLDEINNPDILEKKINKLYNLLKQITLQTRDLSHNLHSAEFDIMSLSELMKQLIRQLSATSKISFTLKDHLPESTELPSKVKVNIYRILQELCANIIKHSDAKTAEVITEIAGDFLSISIRDDGKSFDPDENGTQGAGLINVNSRVFKLGGQITFNKHHESGMFVHLEIPLPKDH
ncbi:PAS domain S-box protein [Rhodohalobacter sp. 8-1]|uniref:PAS domain S-box protein n=1 Tax=Rhodohalobacter sp. 8-1 TaxID=3131972 RepID=UPI0030EE2422